jgi:hypothetical protein
MIEFIRTRTPLQWTAVAVWAAFVALAYASGAADGAMVTSWVLTFAIMAGLAYHAR